MVPDSPSPGVLILTSKNRFEIPEAIQGIPGHTNPNMWPRLCSREFRPGQRHHEPVLSAAIPATASSRRGADQGLAVLLDPISGQYGPFLKPVHEALCLKITSCVLKHP